MEVGGGRGGGSATRGGRRQAVISLTPDADGTGSLLDSILSTFLLPDILGLK